MKITKVEQVSRYGYAIWMDGAYECTLRFSKVREYGLLEGMDISEETYQTILADQIKEAKKKAMDVLQSMDRTEADVTSRLEKAGFSQRAIEEALAYVKKFNYVDDQRYVQLFIEHRQEKKSPMEIKAGLLRKGISSDVIEEAMQEHYCSSMQVQAILPLLEKRRYNKGIDYKEKQKTIAYLSRKGYSFDAIKEAMRLYEEEE